MFACSLIQERRSDSAYLTFFPIRYQRGPYPLRRQVPSVSTSTPSARATLVGSSNSSKQFMAQVQQAK
jgi:hypothetical protein